MKATLCLNRFVWRNSLFLEMNSWKQEPKECLANVITVHWHVARSRLKKIIRFSGWCLASATSTSGVLHGPGLRLGQTHVSSQDAFYFSKTFAQEKMFKYSTYCWSSLFIIPSLTTRNQRLNSTHNFMVILPLWIHFICIPLWTVRGGRCRFQHSLLSLEIPDLWLRSEAVNSLTWSWQHTLSTLADFSADWKSRVSAGTKKKKHYCLFFMLKGGWSDARRCWL